MGDDIIKNDKNDSPALKEMIRLYDEYQVNIIGVKEINDESLSNYGVIKIDETINKDKGIFKIKSLVEKPKYEDAPSNFGVVGRYVLKPEIFEYLSKQEVDKESNEIQITNALSKFARDGNMFAKTLDGKRYDMGSIIGFIEAQINFALDNPDLHEETLKLIKNVIKK